jgi:hypothetical protein
MSKRHDVKPSQQQQRIFPNDYTREELIAELVATGAESFRQATQIEALTRRVLELETLRRQGEEGQVYFDVVGLWLTGAVTRIRSR